MGEPSAPSPATGPAPVRNVERPSPLTGVANAWLAIVAVIVFGGRELLENARGFADPSDWKWPALFALGAILLIALGGLIVGLIQWRTTTFIVDDEFRIERRFIHTSIARIDFTKVQSVDITRPLAARLLGLAEVTIDVGGEGGQRLRFLTLERAEALRDVLLARMAGALPPHQVPDDAHPDDAPRPFEAPAEVVYRANPSNIVLGAVLSFGVGGVLLVAVLLVLFLGPFGVVAGAAWLWLSVLAALWQVPKQLLTNWGFVIERTPNGLRIQRGALTRVQTTLRPERVQTIALRQSLFLRWAGLVTVQISILGNKLGDEQGTGINVLMPFGRFDEARHVISLIWPGVDPTAFAWRLQDPRGRRLTWAAQRWWALEPQTVATRRAMLSDEVLIVPFARIQGLGVSQGPLQRLAGVATCDVHNIDAAPDLAVSHLSPEDARGLFEELRRRSTAARGALPATPSNGPSITQ